MDWFEAKKERGRTQNQNVCLVWDFETEEELAFSLDFFESILGDGKQLMLLSHQRNKLSYTGTLDIIELKWQEGKSWFHLLERGVKMLDRGGLIVLKPGSVLSRFQLQKLRATSPQKAFAFKQKSFASEADLPLNLTSFESWIQEEWSAFFLPAGVNQIPDTLEESQEFFVLNWKKEKKLQKSEMKVLYSDGSFLFSDPQMNDVLDETTLGTLSEIQFQVQFRLSPSSFSKLCCPT